MTNVGEVEAGKLVGNKLYVVGKSGALLAIDAHNGQTRNISLSFSR